MPRHQKTHSEEIFEKARKLVKNEGYSLHKAANELNIPYSTLKDHFNGRYKDCVTQFGQSPLLDAQDELNVVNYAIFMASRGIPLTRPVLKRIALEIIMQRGGDERVNKATGPSDQWVRRFLQRHHSLSVRITHPLERQRAVLTQDTVNDYFDLLEKTVISLNLQQEPARIYNDESGFSGKLNPSKKVIVPRGTRHAYQCMVSLSGHVTLLNAISAAGQTTPPMLIFSKCLPRMVDDGMPDSWTFVNNDKGYIITDLFVQWLDENFIPFIGERCPVLLILDNHSTHVSKAFVDAASKHKVDLLYLPAHSSHLLQPQNAGYFHILKQKVADIVVELGYLGIQTLPRHMFPKSLMQAFNRSSGNTVASAFCTGIYPLNKSALGIISEDLSAILVEAPLPKQKQTSKRKTFTSARSVPSAKPTKKKAKSNISKDDDVVTTAIELTNDQQVERDICVVCMMGDIEEYNWVGCDKCDKWFHYQCLPSYVQTDVDLSLVISTEWMCRYCLEE
ncbi:uncharacterized protein LOC128548809 [Mercenaria mercenaria]|uniref:uncharacterized protein LOC128548809 n=1 Tax=Mercenaria mercenaria TaxID=6596 RepID=UPI00234F43F6|nr:uncharacterized protein LOC128548809 [Mercenaria mercenaria]